MRGCAHDVLMTKRISEIHHTGRHELEAEAEERHASQLARAEVRRLGAAYGRAYADWLFALGTDNAWAAGERRDQAFKVMMGTYRKGTGA